MTRKQRTGYGINVPITKQTDPRNFPVYEFREYPKMMVAPATKEYIQHWRETHSYVDDRTGKLCYQGAAPRLGSTQPCLADEDDVANGFADAVGKAIIASTPAQEKAYWQAHGGKPEAGTVAKPVSVDAPVMGDDDTDTDALIASLEQKNERLRKLLAEKVALEAELDGKEDAPAAPQRRAPPVRRRGRKQQVRATAPRERLVEELD